MKKVSWKDVFFGNFPKLIEIREQEKIVIPDEYTDLTKKMSLAIGVYGFLSGILSGLLISSLFILIIRDAL